MTSIYSALFDFQSGGKITNALEIYRNYIRRSKCGKDYLQHVRVYLIIAKVM